jgi:hypothetical protein
MLAGGQHGRIAFEETRYDVATSGNCFTMKRGPAIYPELNYLLQKVLLLVYALAHSPHNPSLLHPVRPLFCAAHTAHAAASPQL